MVNTKLDISICGPTSVFHFDPHPIQHGSMTVHVFSHLGCPSKKPWKIAAGRKGDVFGENVQCAGAVGTPQVQTNAFPFPRMIDGFCWR